MQVCGENDSDRERQTMTINIGEHEFSECWDGVFYKKLSAYPDITDWELQTISDFIDYEEANGRQCIIEAEPRIKEAVQRFRTRKTNTRISVPDIIKECTACPTYKGCMTDLVCHTSPVENAVSILDCGSLLSPVRSREKSAAELKAEKRNAANDPEDYFDYVMLAWGNCQAGDRLVVERSLGRFPTEEELGEGFTAGVRFYFRYDDIIKHPDATFEGVLPLKVKNGIVLKDWVCAVIVPEKYRNIVSSHAPSNLKDRVHYLDSSGTDIWQWSEKVYEYVRKAIGDRSE